MASVSCVPIAIRVTHNKTSNDEENFYQEQNYKSIIQCIDRGYSHSHITKYQSFKKKTQSKCSPVHRPYESINAAQVQLIEMSTLLVAPMKTRYDNMKAVITFHENELNKMYPLHRLPFKRRHTRSQELQIRFANAQSKCHDLSVELTTLKNKKQIIRNAIAKAKDNQEANKDDYEEQRKKLNGIIREIAEKEEALIKEKDIYRTKANTIYQECRQLEQARLDLYQKTLCDFIIAMHPKNYISRENTIYDELIRDINLKLSIVEDLNSWAETHEIERIEDDV